MKTELKGNVKKADRVLAELGLIWVGENSSRNTELGVRFIASPEGSLYRPDLVSKRFLRLYSLHPYTFCLLISLFDMRNTIAGAPGSNQRAEHCDTIHRQRLSSGYRKWNLHEISRSRQCRPNFRAENQPQKTFRNRRCHCRVKLEKFAFTQPDVFRQPHSTSRKDRNKMSGGAAARVSAHVKIRKAPSFETSQRSNTEEHEQIPNLKAKCNNIRFLAQYLLTENIS